MRTRWEDLHHTFDRSARFCDGGTFMLEARVQSALDPFDDLADLLTYLLRRDGDLAVRDQVLAALVFLTRIEATRRTATALLWLALWPGLCGVYARRRRRGTSADDAVAAICCAFTVLLAEMDPSRVTRVAATLVRSTEREAIAFTVPVGREVEFDDSHAASLRAPCGLAVVEAECLAQRLFGEDALLVVSVAVLEETQAEAAARFGISAAAARKRYQRALQRARPIFASL